MPKRKKRLVNKWSNKEVAKRLVRAGVYVTPIDIEGWEQQAKEETEIRERLKILEKKIIRLEKLARISK